MHFYIFFQLYIIWYFFAVFACTWLYNCYFNPFRSTVFGKIAAARSSTKLNSVVLVRKRTIPTERPQPADVVSAKFSQVVKGILNPRKATEQAVLLENLVQEGHKLKKQNVLVTSTIEEDVSSAL
jgi:hypothetical protein